MIDVKIPYSQNTWHRSKKVVKGPYTSKLCHVLFNECTLLGIYVAEILDGEVFVEKNTNNIQ